MLLLKHCSSYTESHHLGDKLKIAIRMRSHCLRYGSVLTTPVRPPQYLPNALKNRGLKLLCILLKEIEIPDGKGTPLGECPRISHFIKQREVDQLKKLHTACFGKVGKPDLVKENLLQFKGFDYEPESDAYTKKKQQIAKYVIYLSHVFLKEVGELDCHDGGSNPGRSKFSFGYGCPATRLQYSEHLYLWVREKSCNCCKYLIVHSL